jgi:hypothetical protein
VNYCTFQRRSEIDEIDNEEGTMGERAINRSRHEATVNSPREVEGKQPFTWFRLSQC